MNDTTDLYRIERKVDGLTAAINKLVLFEERQTVQALAIIENAKSIKGIEDRHALEVKRLEADLAHAEDKLADRIELGEVKLAMWINRGIGVWALAVTLFTVYKAFAPT